MDNLIENSTFLVGGVGASAGGLNPLLKLVSELPNGGEAFCLVVIQHSSVNNGNSLRRILEKESTWPVANITAGLVPEPGYVYVVPRGANVAIVDGEFVLASVDSGSHPTPSIDHLFTSLAAEYRKRSFGIILSGTGRDGVEGASEIIRCGGVVWGQEPSTAKYGGMVEALVESKVNVRLVKLEQLVPQILEYVNDCLRQESLDQGREGVDQLLAVVKDKTGTDFSRYKMKTVFRRLKKRMEELGLISVDEYLDYFREHDDEIRYLCRKVLIPVTEFFRDSKAFDALQKYFRHILAGKKRGDPIRIWVVGCSTGQEAYSILFALYERLGEEVTSFPIQVFATDLDSECLAVARRGFYTGEEVSRLSPHLLNNYFEPRDGGYLVREKYVRKILFSKHDITIDPPFVKLDLISCRNLLIYFESELQKEIIPLFHYALHEEGLLFLGHSEDVSQFRNLFEVADKENRIYRRSPGQPILASRFARLQRPPLIPTRGEKGIEHGESLMDRARETLFRIFAPPFCIVDDMMHLVEVKGSLRLFLELPDGAVGSNDFFEMVNPDLSMEIRSLFAQVKKTGVSAKSRPQPFELFDQKHVVQIQVLPLLGFEEQSHFMVTFEELPLLQFEGDEWADGDDGKLRRRVVELEHELSVAREHLRSYTHEIKLSQEKMEALNQDLERTNEALRSSNEELETSNEELQSANEELQASNMELRMINDELRQKELQLAREKKQLWTAQNLLRTFFDHSPALLTLSNRDGEFIITNKSWESFQERIDKLSHFSSGMSWRHRWDEFFCQGDEQVWEDKSLLFKKKSGILGQREVHFLVIKFPVLGEDNEMTALGAIYLEITRTEELEKELSRVDQMWHKVCRNLPNAAVYLFDGNYCFSFSEGQELYRWGKSPRDFLGKKLEDMLSRDMSQFLRKNLEKAFDGESINAPFFDEDRGNYYYISIIPLLNEEGEIRQVLALMQNTSELKEAQKKLEEYNRLVSITFERSPICQEVFDFQGRLMMRNRATIELLGREQEIVPMEYNVLGDENLKKTPFYSHFEKAFGGQEVVARELEAIPPLVTSPSQSKRGEEIRYIDLVLYPVFDSHGDFEAVVSYVIDATDRVEQRRRIEESEQLFSQIAGTSPNAIYVRSVLEDKYVFVNEGFRKVFGYAPEDIDGYQEFLDLIHLDDLPAFTQFFEDLLGRKHEEGHTIAYRFLHPDGHYVWLRSQKRIFRCDEQGEVTEILGITSDISDLKSNELALAREKERLSVTLASIGEGVIATNRNGEVVLVNHQAESLLGVSADDIRGCELREVFRVYSNNPEEQLELSRGSYAQRLEREVAEDLRCITAGGREFEVVYCLSSMVGEDGDSQGEVLVFSDVTERRHIEREIGHRQKLESLGVLAGGIAHDFNNLLTTMMQCSSLLSEEFASDNESYEILKNMEVACGKARSLTQQLLTFARGGDPIKKKGRVHTWLEEAVAFSLRGSNVRCIPKIPSDLWGVEVDQGQMTQVVQNLVINGIQAMPKGGWLEVVGRNTVCDGQGKLPIPAGEYICLSFRDWGVGMEKSELAKIFDPYYTTKDSGSGLGLAVCHSVVRKHQGHIEVETEVGVGTTFHIYLPALPESEQDQGEETPSSLPSKYSTGRILIMDDEPLILQVAKKILARKGFEVETGENGLETLEKFQNARQEGRPFDMVILDLTIPGEMGGEGVLNELREIDPDISAVVSSGYANDPVMANYREYGFDEVLQKPYPAQELVQLVNKIISQP